MKPNAETYPADRYITIDGFGVETIWYKQSPFEPGCSWYWSKEKESNINIRKDSVINFVKN